MTDRYFRRATYPFPWYGFNIQIGHIFGTVNDVQYVSSAEPGRDGTIRVYSSQYYAEPGRNWRKWTVNYISTTSPAGIRIMEVKNANPKSRVEVRDVQIDSAFLRGNRKRVRHKVWKKH